MYYLYIKSDNSIIGKGQCPMTMEGETVLNKEVTEEVFEDYEPDKYIYQDGEVILNPQWSTISLNDAKTKKKAENDTARAEALDNGLVQIDEWTAETHKFNTDKDHLTTLNTFYNLIKDGTITDFSWHTYVDYGVNVSETVANKLLQAISTYRNTQYSTHATYTNRINACTTVEQVEAIEITY